MRLVWRLLAQLMIPAMLTANVACSSEDEDMVGKTISSAMNKERAEEVRQLIAAELQVGSDAQEIVDFFERHNISYSYDRFSNRYQAVIRDVSPVLDQAVVIHVYVDREKSFQRAEVQDSFTAP